MFSGQGSQYYRMGEELYENNIQFRSNMDHCNAIVRPLINASLTDILYGDHRKTEPFHDIVYTNPALLSVEYSLFCMLKEMGICPDLLMGYSLGELVAAIVSDAISLEDGLRLVVGIAKLAEEYIKPAGMLAIMESKEIMTEFPDIFHNCWLTGTNFQGNFVVSGLMESILYLYEALNKKNITSQILPVKQGFHTKLIDSIEKGYRQLVRGIDVSSAKIPIISCLKTDIVREIDEDYLWDVIRHPVNFEQTVRHVEQGGESVFIDLGPSGSLATFVKYILSSGSGSMPLQTINQFGKDMISIERLKKHLSENV